MAFTDWQIQQVWQKGQIVGNYDSDIWRQDQCKAWIKKSEYGNRNSQYGWEIDHIKPESEGGRDEISNLRPLQWENNASKQSGRLVCVTTSSGAKNIRTSS